MVTVHSMRYLLFINRFLAWRRDTSETVDSETVEINLSFLLFNWSLFNCSTEKLFNYLTAFRHLGQMVGCSVSLPISSS